MEEGCIRNDYNIRSKGDIKTNDTPSTSNTNNNSCSSKQVSTDKSPEKEKEKENAKGKETIQSIHEEEDRFFSSDPSNSLHKR